jgi:hypothetical protein
MQPSILIGIFHNSGFDPKNVLEDIQHKVVSLVKAAATWVVVVPLFVVHRNPHLGWIAVVQAIATLVVVLTPEVLWVIDIWVVIKPTPISHVGLATPTLTISSLIRVGVF